MPLANKSRCLQRGLPRSVSGKELVDAGVWPSTTLARGRPPTVRTSPWRGSRSRNPLHRQVKTLAPPEIPVWGRGRLTASQADGYRQVNSTLPKSPASQSELRHRCLIPGHKGTLPQSSVVLGGNQMPAKIEGIVHSRMHIQKALSLMG